MEKYSGKIRSFTDLLAWQQGHQLVLDVYRTTSELPISEKFGLINQLQRAVVSVTSNIAEGFSRRSIKEQMQFFFVALGSVKEVQNQLLICRDLHYIDPEAFARLADQTVHVSRLINGLIRSNKMRQKLE